MLVMLDLDNTLNDRAAAVAAWSRGFCAERGLGPGAAEWIVSVDNDGYGARRAVFRAVRDRFDLEDGVDELLASYRAGVRQHLQEVPGARDCLAGIREAGHTTVIVTNGAAESQQHKIDVLGFRDLVDGVIVSGELGSAKPEVAIFRAAAELVGCELDRAWMVGDSGPHDILGAQQLGVSSVWIRRGRNWEPSLPAPTAIIDGLDELVPVLRKRSVSVAPPGRGSGDRYSGRR